MIKAGMVGLGWWGQTLVESVSGESEDLQFVAGAARTHRVDTIAFAKEHNLRLHKSFEEMLDDDDVEAIVLATPHSKHPEQVAAAAARGKHVYCEKPFALTKAGADLAVNAVKEAGVTLAVGYNRRLHPEMVNLRDRINSGDLGVILHIESTMTFPNALFLKADAWRADTSETPCGGLTPMGVHAIDGMIDLCGSIDEVYAQSFRRAVEVDADDTTSILLRMDEGMSGYLGTMTATGGGFSFQVYGSKGFVRLEGKTHTAGASSEERRTQLFGNCMFKPVKGPAETWQAEQSDIVRATLDAFGRACVGKEEFPIPVEDMVHSSAVTEAIVKSASAHQVTKVER